MVNLFCSEPGCDFKTHSPFSMNVHKRAHKRDKGELGSSFFCHICAKEFSSSPYLKWHIAYAHEKKADDIRDAGYGDPQGEIAIIFEETLFSVEVERKAEMGK